MSTLSHSPPRSAAPPELRSGDRMNRAEFHRLYENTPKHFKAELIGGTVYVASPLGRAHANRHGHLGMLFAAYELNTPGTESGDNATVLLGEESEPQPDLLLRILPDFGGQSATDRHDYVQGAPELIAEVAHSSRSIDLHAKRADYAHNGVREYLVLSVKDHRLYWFDLPSARELSIGSEGIIRVQSFPGFWINVEALFESNYKGLMATFHQGLATPEHAEFVRRLAAAKKTS